MTTLSTFRRHTILLTLLLSALAGCATDAQTRWHGPFFFIQLADPQFGMFTNNKDVAKEAALLAQAIDHANRLRPAFVVICGDLINRPGDDSQIADFLQTTSRLDPAIPLVFVPGNHDVGNTPTPDSLNAYRERFGPDHRVFYHGGCRFIIINTTLIHDPKAAQEQCNEQEAWLKHELTTPQTPRPVHTILFQHHPWFNKTPDEPNAYENIPQPERGRYLDLLTRAGVTAVFAGHRHGNSIARCGNMEIVASGPIGKPLGKDPSGLRIVEVYKDRIVHNYYAIDAVPERIPLAAK
jgi:serine/threonine-protein phosphatase CPPED1